MRGEVNPRIEKIDSSIIYQGYLRDKIEDYLKDLYRWGVLLDPKYIYLTNSSSYLKTVYKVLSELTDDIGIDYEARFFKIGANLEQVVQ